MMNNNNIKYNLDNLVNNHHINIKGRYLIWKIFHTQSLILKFVLSMEHFN